MSHSIFPVVLLALLISILFFKQWNEGCMHTTFVYVADKAELEDITGTAAITPIMSGLCTGLVYKSTSGPRGALLAGVIGAVGSCVYWYGGSYAYNILLGRGGKY